MLCWRTQACSAGMYRCFDCGCLVTVSSEEVPGTVTVTKTGPQGLLFLWAILFLGRTVTLWYWVSLLKILPLLRHQGSSYRVKIHNRQSYQ